jgi:hypothetical protein
MTSFDRINGTRKTVIKAATTVDADVDSPSINCAGYDQHIFVITTGAFQDYVAPLPEEEPPVLEVIAGEVTITVEDSADDSTFAPVAGVPTLTLGEADENSVFPILVRSANVRQYVRLNFAGTEAPILAASCLSFTDSPTSNTNAFAIVV